VDPDGEPRLWHVTVTVAGPEESLEQVRNGLEAMSHDHPFLMAGRYATDRAEVRYWEEAEDVHHALALALRLWGEHRESSGLPQWTVVGLEVVDRDTHRRRGDGAALLSPGVRPF
jgi:orotidine-5'-phosphate decarboxylase